MLPNRFYAGFIRVLGVPRFPGVVRQSLGSPDPISMGDLASKSLFLTRWSMMHYTGTRDELLKAAGEVFANVVYGVLHIRVKHTHPLPEASRAHADLKARKTPGSILLTP